jgi:hypothetical protein
MPLGLKGCTVLSPLVHAFKFFYLVYFFRSTKKEIGMFVVWYDGFLRHREECLLVSETETTMTFKGTDGEDFTILKTQLVKID